MNLSKEELLTLRNLVYLEIQSVVPWAQLPVEHRGAAPRRKAHLEELLDKLDRERQKLLPRET